MSASGVRNQSVIRRTEVTRRNAEDRTTCCQPIFTRQWQSAGILVRVLLVMTGLAILAGCGGGSSSTPTPVATVTLSATTLTFATAIGTTSAAQTITVTDSGTAAVTFSGFTTSPIANFAETNNCGTEIGAGTACTVNVTFTSSTAVSALAGTLTITDNAGTQTVNLSGTAATPTVTVSPSSLTFSSQGVGTSSAAQTVTVTSTGTVPVTINSVTFTGANPGDFSESFTPCNTSGTCTISVTFTPTATGARTATLNINDNASGSPQTVSLTGTGASAAVSLSPNTLTFASVAVGSSAPPQSVTLQNNSSAALAISSIMVTSGSANFSETNTCGAGIAAGATCPITVTFTPSTAGPLTGAVTITDNAGGVTGSTQTINLSGTGFSNTVPVNVNLGLTDNYVNGIFVTVTVCVPGTTNCTTIPDVLVDTGSYGLRLLGSGAENITGTQVGSLSLPQVTDPTSGYPEYECVMYGDLSFTWGPIQMATVTVGAESASQLPGAAANTGIPIQVITNSSTPPESIDAPDGAGGQAPGEYYNPCITYENSNGQIEPTGGADDDTVANLESNGILGIGIFPQDCVIATTNFCAETAELLYMGYDASTGDAVAGPTPLADQVWNPIAAFPVDNNGVQISLPSLGAANGTGAATATGTLTFGIGTETNNAIPSGATVYEADDVMGYFQSAVYNGVTYTSNNSGGTFIDSGSNALYILDETTLGTESGVTMEDCIVSGTDIGWYCPVTGTTPEPFDMAPLTLGGANNTSTNVSLVLGNYDTLSATGNAALNNLSAPSCSGGSAAGCSASTDYIDLGLPFFFGQPNGIFVGISEGATFPNGFWAF